MKENVGGTERVVRAMAGPALLAVGLGRLGARRGRAIGLAATLGGAIISGTAISGACPANAVIGRDSKR